MFDLPPQQFETPKTEMEYKVDQEVLNSDFYTLDTSNVVDTLEPATSDDILVDYAKKVKAEFDDGFQWSDIAAIIALSSDLVADMFNIEDQRDAVIKIIDHVIAMTDTPYLPDSFTDPLFKAMIHPLVNLGFNILHGKVSLRDISAWEVDLDKTGELTQEDMKQFASKVAEVFDDGFQWEELANMVSISMEFIDTFADMGYETRRNYVVEIIDYVIDITDTPYLPDGFVDPVFKELVPPFVEFFMKRGADMTMQNVSDSGYLAGCPFKKKLMQHS